MRTQDFIMGLMVAMACIITMISYASFAYRDMGVTVDPQTSALLQKFNETSYTALSTTKDVTNDVRGKAPGGENQANANAGETIESNLVAQGWRAIVGIPKSFTAFGQVLGLVEGNLNPDGQGHNIWSGIAYASLTFVICLLLISAIMRNFQPQWQARVRLLRFSHSSLRAWG
jgi:hypothetical protein